MKKLFLLALLIVHFSSLFLFANAGPDTFKEFPNKYFVESGSYKGEGIRCALNTGFEYIYSVELNHSYYNYCKNMFLDNPNVFLFMWDSGDILFDIIKDINEPITFWLDGHCTIDSINNRKSHSPILKELEAIKKHHIKNHTILIDDIRDFGTLWFDFVTLSKVIEKIMEINPNYKISYLDGCVANDILVAEIR